MATGTGAALGGATWWLSASKQRTARWARRLLADAQRKVPPASLRPRPEMWDDNQVTFAWLGHATVLINFYGIRILTDPALGMRVGVATPFGTIGPKRYVAPALSFKDLPPIDLVLLSHAHMDHMDLLTLRRFARRASVVTAKVTLDVLGSRFTNVEELAWNGKTLFKNHTGNLQIEAFEVKHWGQRWPSELQRGYNGYILRREGKAILFGGDTARTPLFAAIRSHGPFAAAIMPIGAYQPWIWNHCTPEQALEMANAARAEYIVPVHHQTFRLSEEPALEPIERLQVALAKEPERLALSQVGDTFVLPS